MVAGSATKAAKVEERRMGDIWPWREWTEKREMEGWTERSCARRGLGRRRNGREKMDLVEVVDAGAGCKVEDELARSVLLVLLLQDLNHLDKLLVGLADHKAVL